MSTDPNIAMLEQPVAVAQTSKLALLSSEEKKIICLDESLKNFETALAWEASAQFPGTIFNIKLMKCGGIHGAQKISDIARRNNIQLMLGCMDESVTSISAALGFAYAQPHCQFIDLDGSFDLIEDIFSGGFTLQDGYMFPSNALGIGVKERL